MDDATKLLREMNGLFEKAQQAIVDYLPPDSGISEHEALNRLIGILDGPEQRRIQGAVKELLGERSAIFADAE